MHTHTGCDDSTVAELATLLSACHVYTHRYTHKFTHRLIIVHTHRL